LEFRSQTQGEVHWFAQSQSDCLAEYRVTFKNVGKTSIDLTQGRLRVWEMPTVSLEKAVNYVDPRALTKNQRPIVDETFNEGNLIEHYAPDVSDTLGFNFRVRRNAGGMVLFQFDAKSPQNPDGWYDYQWDYACGEASPPRKNKK